MFNPGVLPPMAWAAPPSSAPTLMDVRPILFTQNGAGRTRRRRGGGYQTPQQFFNPYYSYPAPVGMPLSSAATVDYTRPPLVAQVGRGRTRRMRGGFTPSVMGSFAANAQAAVVPAVLYLVYHTMVPKNMGAKVGSAMKKFLSRRTSRKNQ